jgi:hypothetical protein
MESRVRAESCWDSRSPVLPCPVLPSFYPALEGGVEVGWVMCNIYYSATHGSEYLE